MSNAHHINQISLISAIIRELDKQGVKDMPPSRQMDAVIAAANSIVAAFAVEKLATKGMSYQQWHDSDDTGLSSVWLAKTIHRMEMKEILVAYPHDPSDFGRCVRMLENIEGAKELFSKRLGEASAKGGPVWRIYLVNWDEMLALWNEESPSGKCPKLYALMQELQEVVRSVEP